MTRKSHELSTDKQVNSSMDLAVENETNPSQHSPGAGAAPVAVVSHKGAKNPYFAGLFITTFFTGCLVAGLGAVVYSTFAHQSESGMNHLERVHAAKLAAKEARTKMLDTLDNQKHQPDDAKAHQQGDLDRQGDQDSSSNSTYSYNNNPSYGENSGNNYDGKDHLGETRPSTSSSNNTSSESGNANNKSEFGSSDHNSKSEHGTNNGDYVSQFVDSQGKPCDPNVLKKACFKVEHRGSDDDNLHYEKSDNFDKSNRVRNRWVGTNGPIYLIHQGDTLSEISAKVGVSVDRLAKYNDIRDPNLIYAGSALEIPQR